MEKTIIFQKAERIEYRFTKFEIQDALLYLARDCYNMPLNPDSKYEFWIEEDSDGDPIARINETLIIDEPNVANE